MTELIILAAIAAFILYQLYNVLGRKVGHKGDEKPVTAKPADEAVSATAKAERVIEAVKLPNLDVLKTRDANFNEVNFLEKARETYEQVVQAFHVGDLSPVKSSLNEKVYNSFSQAVSARAEAPTDRLIFIDPPKADIDVIDFSDETARIRVRFLSELAYEAAEGGARNYKRTAEYWTFQKALKGLNESWLLSRVEAARA